MEAGRKIKEHMRKTGRTQVWLSRTTGISRERLSLMLSGKRRMHLEDYALICGALDVDANQFIAPERKKGMDRPTE